MDNYASFIGEALEKTRCRECVPSWEEIQVLMGRQEMLCTVHYPGPGSCQLHISSHTTANEVRGDLSIISVSLSLYQDLRTPSPILSSLVDLCGDLHCKDPASWEMLVSVLLQTLSLSLSPLLGGEEDVGEAGSEGEQKHIFPV